MKYSIILIFIFALTGCKDRSESRSIEGILIKPSASNLSCGLLKVWVGMKFKAKYAGGELIGLIQCPETYDSLFFQEGNSYFLEMISILPDAKDKIIIDNFETEFARYYIEKIVKR